MSELPICKCSVGMADAGHATDCPVRLFVERLQAKVEWLQSSLRVIIDQEDVGVARVIASTAMNYQVVDLLDTAPCSLCGEDVRTVPEGGALCETCAAQMAEEQ